MSKLRRIICQGDATALKNALQDVKLLSEITPESRQRILSAYTRGQTTNKIKLDLNPEESEVPDSFQTNTNTLLHSCNAYYQLAQVVWYMMFDPALFGRWMLHGEPPQLQDQFMKILRESISYFIQGKQMQGQPFKSGDNLHQRRTGAFICHVRNAFSIL